MGELDDAAAPSPLFGRAPGAVWRSIPEMLVVTIDGEAPLRIAGSAALVWQHLHQPTTFDVLVARLEQDVSGPSPEIRDDVRHLLDELVARGVVTVA